MKDVEVEGRSAERSSVDGRKLGRLRLGNTGLSSKGLKSNMVFTEL
jgi:hypothetical protein